MIDESGQSSGFGVVPQPEDTITAINKAMETLRQPKSMSMFASQGDMLSELLQERKMAASTIESLQRENERLAGLVRDNGTPRFNAVCERYETAEAEVKRLRDALKPFADIASSYDPPEDDDDQKCWHAESTPTIGDLRRARALSSTGDTHGN